MRFTESLLNDSVETHVVEGVSVKVFEVVKTIADCFRYRDKVGLSAAIEASRKCFASARPRPANLISGARISLTIDIGFGDALEPGAEELDYPSMLDFPIPRLRGYARETVIAEKFQAMVALGQANSRMKDFYDIWILSRSFTFDDNRLPRAIRYLRATRDGDTARPAGCADTGLCRGCAEAATEACFCRRCRPRPG